MNIPWVTNGDFLVNGANGSGLNGLGAVKAQLFSELHTHDQPRGYSKKVCELLIRVNKGQYASFDLTHLVLQGQ